MAGAAGGLAGTSSLGLNSTDPALSGLPEGEIARKKAESKLFGLTGAQSDRIR